METPFKILIEKNFIDNEKLSGDDPYQFNENF